MVKISMKKKVQQVTFRFFLDLMMWKIATTSMSVFWNLDCLSLVICSNTNLLKLQTVLFFVFFFNFFFKFCASKSGVRLIYGCGLYTDVYGTFPCHLPAWLQLYVPGPESLTSGSPCMALWPVHTFVKIKGGTLFHYPPLHTMHSVKWPKRVDHELFNPFLLQGFSIDE